METIDTLHGEGVAIIIVAGGSGSRMNSPTPKQFMLLEGVPILVRSVEQFRRVLPKANIMVALPAAHIKQWDILCEKWGIRGNMDTCEGGETRFDSVNRALTALGDCSWIIVHDAVRPLVSGSMIHNVLSTAVDFDTAVPVIEPVDSFRKVTECGSHIIERTLLRGVQTPQAFSAALLRNAYQTVIYDPNITDDASVVERYGVAIRLCEGERSNIKITTPEDMAIAKALLESML